MDSGIVKCWALSHVNFGIRLPAVLRRIRTDEGREKRKLGIEEFKYNYLYPRIDGISNTLTGVLKDNLIMQQPKKKKKNRKIWN